MFCGLLPGWMQVNRQPSFGVHPWHLCCWDLQVSCDHAVVFSYRCKRPEPTMYQEIRRQRYVRGSRYPVMTNPRADARADVVSELSLLNNIDTSLLLHKKILPELRALQALFRADVSHANLPGAGIPHLRSLVPRKPLLPSPFKRSAGR